MTYSKDEWIDITALGDKYEIQVNSRTNEYRWRSRPLYAPYAPEGRITGYSLLSNIVKEAQWTYGSKRPK